MLAPGEEGYEEARRVWNGAVDRRPALIAQCAGVDDVQQALRFALERDLRVAVRGGGRSIVGHSVVDDGIVIDLSHMKAVSVDPATRVAHAGGGLTWSELDLATQHHGLAVTGAVVSHVGVAGTTLGGGLGHLMRRHGFTADNLLSVDLVTAGADRVRVDAEREPELFWALRGGGGNFGIATAFDYRVHPVGPLVLGGPIYWPLEQAPMVLRVLREFAPDAPDELGMMLVAHRGAADAVPAAGAVRGAGDRPLARVVRRHRRRAARRRSVAGGRHPVGRCRSSGPVPCRPDPPRRQRSAGHPGVLEVAPPQ